jgi:hypothetical protein
MESDGVITRQRGPSQGGLELELELGLEQQQEPEQEPEMQPQGSDGEIGWRGEQTGWTVWMGEVWR